MRRQFRIGLGDEGTEDAQAKALALAQVAGPELLQAFLELTATVSRFGGEIYIAAYREKAHYAPVETPEGVYLERTEVKPDEPGDWETVGYAVHYESVGKATAKVTQNPKESEAKLTQPNPLPKPEQVAAGNGMAPETAEV